MSVIFDQLRISDDGRRMYVDAHVNLAPQFEDTYIEGLYICLGSQIYQTLNIDPESNGHIYSKTYDEGVKEIHEVITTGKTIDTIPLHGLSKNLFFVYIKCTGIPDECKCLTNIGNYNLDVTFDSKLLYQRAMEYTKAIGDVCDVPVGFTDFILLWNAFKASIETEHYFAAIKFYNMLFGTKDGKDYGPYGKALKSSMKGCGCHG